MPILTLALERVPTPLGIMLLANDETGRLRVIDWEDHEQNMLRLLRLHYRGTEVQLRETQEVSAARRAVEAYFDGELNALESLQVGLGGTDFQRAVWSALRDIPVGTTISYLELARRIGRPGAMRAVGLANGANPISIVVPCHRVIGSNAKLVGYGGGMHRKQWLLAHEKAVIGTGPGRQRLKDCPPNLSLPGF